MEPKRRDGRPLVTEFPVTAMDRIEYAGHIQAPERTTLCRRSRERDPYKDAWMEPDEFDIGEWDA